MIYAKNKRTGFGVWNFDVRNHAYGMEVYNVALKSGVLQPDR